MNQEHGHTNSEMAKSQQNLAITSTISRDGTAGLTHEHDENLASVLNRRPFADASFDFEPDQPTKIDKSRLPISSFPELPLAEAFWFPARDTEVNETRLASNIHDDHDHKRRATDYEGTNLPRPPLYVNHVRNKSVVASANQMQPTKFLGKDTARNVPGDGGHLQIQQRFQAPKQWQEDSSLFPSATGKRAKQSKPKPVSSDEIFAVSCVHKGHALLYRDRPKIQKQPYENEHGRGHEPAYRELPLNLDRHFAGGDYPIGVSLKRYLERRKSISVLILRIVECPHIVEPRESDMEESLWSEHEHIELDSKPYLLIVSPVIQDAMTQFAKFPLPDGSTLPLPRDLQAPRSIGVIEETMFYFHHFNELQGFIEVVPEQHGEIQHNCFSAFAEALRRVALQWNERCVQVRAMHDNGEVTLESIELLFHPNMPVVARPADSKGEPIVCIALEIKANLLSGWRWEYDGKVFFRKSVSLQISSLSDRPVRIADLEAYPLSHASRDVIDSMKARAETMWRLREQSFIAYSGLDANDDRCYRDERFIVDTATLRRIHKGGVGFDRMEHKDQMQLLPNEISLHDRKPEGVVLLALPAVVSGYNLHDKEWYLLRVKNVKDIRYNKKAFDRLVLPPDIKELVQALVETQGKVEGAGDVISGKGNGLILLLHGGPGTGKTLTAESVAELAEKPLYRVTCGDIGTDPEDVEKYLNGVLYLGKTWDCIVLLDEADVFLEGRDLNDLARNSLVSVFLRTLEYFEGILILTTNRVGTFDEAFKSRIQVALHYPDLTPKVRRQIWQNLLELIKEDESLDIDVDDILEHIGELKNADLNGRQIRDAINTSRRLALYRKEKMAWRHVSQVVRIVGQFNQDLEKIHKHKDAERARELGWRA